jgi:hypothetical protein
MLTRTLISHASAVGTVSTTVGDKSRNHHDPIVNSPDWRFGGSSRRASISSFMKITVEMVGGELVPLQKAQHPTAASNHRRRPVRGWNARAPVTPAPESRKNSETRSNEKHMIERHNRDTTSGRFRGRRASCGCWIGALTRRSVLDTRLCTNEILPVRSLRRSGYC